MRKATSAAALCLAGSVAFVLATHGQGRGGGTWSEAGGDAQLSGFQKIEPRLTRATLKNAKLLWKIKLGSAEATQPTEPLFAGHTITNAGFKDMVLVYGPDNTLTNVDYEQGIVLWQRHIAGEAGKPNAACANGQFSTMIVQPTATFSLAAGRGAAARGRGAEGARGAAPAPVPTGPPPNPPAVTPRVGGNLAGGVGFGGLRGIFVQTADGSLHEQELNNGWDYGPSVKFTPAGANLGAPLIVGSTIYETAGGCGGANSGVYALDMTTDAYDVASYKTGSVPVTGTDGPALSTDEKTLFVTTGSGAGSGDVHANSVVALDAKTLQVKDYYTPSGAEGKTNINVSPAVFEDNGRDLVAVYVAGGRLALLDSSSLGGSDHHTPLAITAPLSNDAGEGAWGRLATADDADGTRFIYVSLRGPLADTKLPSANGAVTDGAIVAFRVMDQGGKIALTPAWVSPNVENPSPASVIMNTAPQTGGGFGAPAEPATPSPAVKAGGVVFTLSQGETGKTHARLYGFDAETGAQVFSSGDEVAAPANDASISISGAHVLFVTSDDTLYAFGISYEKD